MADPKIATRVQVAANDAQAIDSEANGCTTEVGPRPAGGGGSAADDASAQEADTQAARVYAFTSKGVTLAQAQTAADRLVVRDRERDDRAMCLECAYLHGHGRWRCGNWQQADMAREGIAPALVVMLQRCTGFKGFN